MLGLGKSNGARVPMDDHHTLNFFMLRGAGRRRWPMASRAPLATPSAVMPRTTDWYGRFRMEQNLANDF